MEHISNQLEKISQVPAKQELQPLKTTEAEAAFVSALQDRPVKDCSLEELKEVLRRVFVKVGLREANFPYGEEKDLLHEHILVNYGGHTRKEIVLAFEMGMQGKLEVDMTTYENFSCLYFSHVMNAYREWAKQAYRQNVKETPPMIEYKEDTSEQAMKDWYEKTAREVRAGKLRIEFVPLMLFEWLERKGVLTDWEKYQVEAAVHIGKAFGADAAKGINKSDYVEFKVMFKNSCFEGKYINEIQDLARKMSVWDHILKNLAV